eukprot:TRINITY_DN2133_c0_g1_i2.p1 TRINITY_DN2133_c0_g1~~TRINITY_DN2133_c0_g1_i2.p1  ORF type:complete len:280 (+),score=34.09 TRINITY_DN2133_c0_g1_i2:70-909(+)
MPIYHRLITNINKTLPKISYGCDLDELPDDLKDLWVPLKYDEAADRFIRESMDRTPSILTCVLRPALACCISQTDINGIFSEGEMHVLSCAQLKQLLPPFPEGRENFGRLLDIGAGDGNVTQEISPLFEKIVTTEVSRPMVHRLRGRGFECVRTGDLLDPVLQDLVARTDKFDVVCCLNVFDRCQQPLSLLQHIKFFLKSEPHARIVFAVPLPLDPIRAEQEIPIEGCCFEHDLVELARLLEESGFRIHSMSKVPYLCQGDFRSLYYVLHDALFILSPL